MIHKSPMPLAKRGPTEIEELLAHMDAGGILLFRTAYAGQGDYIATRADWKVVGGDDTYSLHYPHPHLKQVIDRDQMWAQIRYGVADIVSYD